MMVATIKAIPGAFVAALKKSIVFAGRASRLEFVAFFVITGIIGYAAAEVSVIADIIGWIFFLATLPPFVSVTVRRLHDINASGWWSVVIFLPYFFAFAYPAVEYTAIVAEATAPSGIILFSFFAGIWSIAYITIMMSSGIILFSFFAGIWSIAYITIMMLLVFKGGNKDDNKYGAPPEAVLQGA